MIIKFSDGTSEKLPSDLELNDRLLLVNKILAEHSEDFNYKEDMFDNKGGTRMDINLIPKVRLDILGSYLIKATLENCQSTEIMSAYKQKVRVYQEMPFSQYSETQEIYNLI